MNAVNRYAALNMAGLRMAGINNIELISDRPLQDNLREIAEVKRRFPAHAVIVSLMVESTREAWHEIVKQAEDTGCDGLELNFGCPHGMSERGMGAAVGQVPEYTQMITEWVKEVAAHAGVCEALAQYYRYRAGRTRGGGRRGRRHLADQHDQ